MVKGGKKGINGGKGITLGEKRKGGNKWERVKVENKGIRVMGGNKWGNLKIGKS